MNMPYCATSIPLGIYPAVMGIHVHQKKPCSTMFMVVLLIIAKVWKQLKCPTAVAWIMYGIVTKWNTMQQYKRNELPLQATTWINIMSGRSWLQKRTCCIITQ